MGFFFSSHKNRLSAIEIKQALAELGILERSDKKEILRRLKKRKAGGITKLDIIEVTFSLKKDTDDSVDRTEAEATRRKLLDELDKKDQ